MGHQTILYGFIEGSTYKPGDDYRKLQKLNESIIEQIPEEDEYPFLTKSMFSYPDSEPTRGTYRAKIIHFGGTQKGLMWNEVPVWVDKFEKLLSELYWFEAVAHIWTDYVDGCYMYWWNADDSIIESYRNSKPIPTNKWKRKIIKQIRHLNEPPTNEA